MLLENNNHEDLTNAGVYVFIFYSLYIVLYVVLYRLKSLIGYVHDSFQLQVMKSTYTHFL